MQDWVGIEGAQMWEELREKGGYNQNAVETVGNSQRTN